MKARPHGFVMVEIVMALAIFSGVMMVLLYSLNRTKEYVALDGEYISATSRLSRTIEETRRGMVTVREGADVAPAPPAGVKPMRDETCVVRVEPWPGDPSLRKVTVKVQWRSQRGRPCVVRASTLVASSRLKLEGAKP